MHKSKSPYQLPIKLVCSSKKFEEAMGNNSKLIELVEEYIKKHSEMNRRYDYLYNLYIGFHDIFYDPAKENWKPDNRLAVNFPRYLIETFLGYSYGHPIKETHPDETINGAFQNFQNINDISDHEFELFKKTCIYGHAYEFMYQDEEGNTRVTALAPSEIFVVYDETVRSKALFAVRYGMHTEDCDVEKKGDYFGDIMTRGSNIHFDGERILEDRANVYGLIPVVEYKLNEERLGLFENVSGAIETYNRTLSEKANDIDSFAEAYLLILGAEIDEDGIYKVRDNRLINLYGTDDAKDILVQFLQKPTADNSQENLLNRLEDLIYITSMVANISDETFGNSSSGTALSYKLQAMSNFAKSFDRKISKSISKRYKLFCSLPNNVGSKQDEYKRLELKFTRNIPNNITEEIANAQSAAGLISEESQLNLLSFITDVSEEIKRKRTEEEEQNKTALDSYYSDLAKEDKEGLADV